MIDCSSVNTNNILFFVDNKKVELIATGQIEDTHYFRTKSPYELVVPNTTGRWAYLSFQGLPLLPPNGTPQGAKWTEKFSNPSIPYYQNNANIFFPPGPPVVNLGGAGYQGFAIIDGGYCRFYLDVNVNRKIVPPCSVVCLTQYVDIAPTTTLYLRDAGGVIHRVTDPFAIGCDRKSADSNILAAGSIKAMITSMFPECDTTLVGVSVQNTFSHPNCARITITNSPIKFVAAFTAGHSYKFTGC